MAEDHWNVVMLQMLLRFMLRIPSGNVVVSLLLSWKVSDSSWWEGEREDLPEEWQSGNTGNTEMVEGKLKKILCPRSCVKKRFLVRFKEVTDLRLSYIWRECGEIKEKRHARSMDGLVTKNNCYSTVWKEDYRKPLEGRVSSYLPEVLSPNSRG